MRAPPPKLRVAVTGTGLISPLGLNRRDAWERIREGRCGIGPIGIVDDPRLTVRIGGVAPLPRGASPFHGLGRRLRRLSRTDLLCLAASREALEVAGCLGREGNILPVTHDFGISVGSTTGGMLDAEETTFLAAERGGLHRVRAGAILSAPCLSPALAVARWAGLRGPCLANTTACSSGAEAVALAADAIRRGDAPAMLAGGADALCRLTLSGFGALKLLDPEPCRPFDASRQGLSLGEGSGMLLLEELESARARGARILAEFLDYGSSCDAYHPTASDPRGEGAAAAMRVAIDRAGVETGEVDYINAHGTGTSINDASEVEAVRKVFGLLAPRIPISSTKSFFGHALGAAGGLEAVIAVTALETQMLPPTLNWRTGDPGFELDVVPGAARPARIRVVLSNNFGFGGGNCTLVFSKGALP